MRQRLARDLFGGVVDALVAGAPHLQGMEWEAVILVSAVPVPGLALAYRVTVELADAHLEADNRFLLA